MKNVKIKRLLGLFVSIFLIGTAATNFLSAAPVSSTSYTATEPDWGTPVLVSDIGELRAAITAAPANTPTEIRITSNIVLDTSSPVSIPANRYIKLSSEGGPYKIDADRRGRTVNNVGRLFTANIIITGAYIADSSTGGGLSNSGTFTMLEGTVITGNEAMTGAGMINNGTFNMYGGAITGNTARSSGGALDNQTPGVFTMYGGEISFNTAGNNGGGIFNTGWNIGSSTISRVIIKGGSIHNNTAAVNGGGIHNRGESGIAEMTIEDGEIFNNKAQFGGGVSNVTSTRFVLAGGEIFNNEAVHGGGIYQATRSDLYDLVINDGEISKNIVTQNGGGIWTNRPLTIADAEIIDNTAGNNGGGIFKDGAGAFTMNSGAITGNTANDGGGTYVNNGNMVINVGTISGNTAINNGGGVWITDTNTNFDRLSVAAGVIFADNSASIAYNRDAADDADYAAFILGTAWTSPFEQGYNNYDISYIGSDVATILTVTFDNNYNSSIQSENIFRRVFSGKTVGKSMPLNPTRSGYSFVGWNTSADGTGTMFEDETVVTQNITVYAQWVASDEEDTTESITDPKDDSRDSEKSISNIPQTGNNFLLIAAMIASLVAPLLILSRRSSIIEE